MITKTVFTKKKIKFDKIKYFLIVDITNFQIQKQKSIKFANYEMRDKIEIIGPTKKVKQNF